MRLVTMTLAALVFVAVLGGPAVAAQYPPPVAVEPAVEVVPADISRAEAARPELARTGGDLTVGAALAAAMLLGGGGLVLVARRRSTARR